MNEEMKEPNTQEQQNDESVDEASDDQSVEIASQETQDLPEKPEESGVSSETDQEGEALRLPIELPSFSGPLDLLVHLISKHEMDVFSISISAITNEYLKTIKEWQEQDLELAGEYLVLAATLIRYKARALLPKEEQEEEEEEIDDAILEARRQEYERFRQLAEDLRIREEESAGLFPRVGPSPEGPREVVEYEEVSVYDLYHTFQRIIEEIGSQPPRTVEGESYSVDEKMLEIEALLEHNERIVLTDYLRRLESKLEMIVVFMALLELIRLREVKATQEQSHAEILLVKGEKLPNYSDEETEDESNNETNSDIAENNES